MSELTVNLRRVQEGEAKAVEELLPLVYEGLRKLATCRMAHEPAGHTLQPTALVHEAWLRLGVMPLRNLRIELTSLRPPPKPCAAS